MSNISLIPGSRYIKDGSISKIIKTLDKNNFEIQDENTKKISVVSQDDLVQNLFKGNLRFLATDINSKSDKSSKYPDFSVVDSKYRETAVLRYKCIGPLLNLPSRDRTIEKVEERISHVSSDPTFDKITKGQGRNLHVVTVYRWIRAYEENGRDIRDLLPSYDRCGAKGKTRTDKEIEELVEEAIKKVHLNKMRPHMMTVYEHVQQLILNTNKFRAENEKLSPVSYDTVRRRIKSLNNYDVTRQRYDIIEAEKRLGMKGEGLRPTRPIEIAEIDHTKADIFVTDGENEFVLGRPWITSMVDKYSRYPLGFHIGFDEPSYLSVMYCLYHSISPKDYVHEKYPKIKNNWSAYGIPETLVVDNGKEFHSSSLEDACLQLNINLQYSPPGMPWYKGTVERSFGGLNDSLLNNLPGKSFSSWDKRGSYDPVKDASVSFESFNEIIHKHLVDVYSQKFHRGINDIPQILWDNGVEAYPPHLPCRKEDLIVLLGAIEERTITPKGIEFKGLFYNSRELIQLLNSGITGKTRRVRFKYNPNDLSQIWVYDEVDNKFIEVKAINQQYTKGLSKWQHEVVINKSKRAKERVDAEALIEAKAEINRIVEKDKKELAKKRKSSARIAKWSQVSSNTGIAQEMENGANSLETDSVTKASKTNISDAYHDSPDITIIESRQEDVTAEGPAADNRRSNHGIKNGMDEPEHAPKDETEFDLTGWGISSKAEEPWKGHNKKSADSAATKEGNHGK